MDGRHPRVGLRIGYGQGRLVLQYILRRRVVLDWDDHSHCTWAALLQVFCHHNGLGARFVQESGRHLGNIECQRQFSTGKSQNGLRFERRAGNGQDPVEQSQFLGPFRHLPPESAVPQQDPRDDECRYYENTARNQPQLSPGKLADDFLPIPSVQDAIVFAGGFDGGNGLVKLLL